MVSISRDPFFLSALESDHALPTEQALANAAIIAIFAYLVPLLTMEINFFRLAVYRSWRRDELKMKRKQRKRKQQQQTNAEHGGVAIEMSLMQSASANNDDAAADAGGDLPRNQTRSSEVLLDSNNSTHSTSSKDNLLQPNSNINIDNDINNTIDNDDNGDDSSSSSSSASAVGHLITSISTALHDVTSITTLHLNSPRPHSHSSSHNHHHQLPINSPSLQAAYHTIRTSSMQAILSSLVVYTITAVGVAYNTRGLDEKVVAIIVGTSQFMASMMVFIVSAKVPQWIGVYHQGSIRLVKCSSSYSEQFTKLKLSNDTTLQKLKYNVRLGVWFHFAKFYIICMPFYCGVQEATIPISIVSGSLFGFVLMWAVFVVHEKYIQHRNIVSFTTILLLTIVSSLAFVRGMAWMQVVWRLDILKNEDTLLVISFFAWLALLAGVHTLFLWHTLRREEAEKNNKKNAAAMMAEEHEEEEEEEEVNNNDLGASTHTNKLGNRKGKSTMRRNSSYSSFVFDPRIHFKDGKCQFSDHPDVEAEDNDSLTHELSMDAPLSSNDQANDDEVDVHNMQDYYIETPIVADNADNDGNVVQMELNDDDDELDNEETTAPSEKTSQSNNNGNNHQTKNHKIRRERPTWCTVFICFTPEYEQSSTLWKIICWIKITILTLSYLLCLYFVIICIGATYQVNTVRAALPAVQEALYNHMDEGEVCAFDNRGPDSNITTFANKDAAHDAGFLIVHCGACEACSSWENLIKEWTTRDTMAALANHCAKESLFGGGDDAITECLMNPETIGFGYECAVCWAEDIVCTKEHCTFIFLQSQMINNVGNFAVGENAITSANCEEAHCEVGQFVPCSGATRRRMNIVSSISRPGNQQCGIVDVGDWEDLFFGSGVVQK